MDKYEKELEDKMEIMTKCEHRQNNSCMKCVYMEWCETRKDYVKAVYNSMSKGETGGFEF